MRNGRIYDMTEIALMTALTCVMAQIVIPLPGGVPMTLQTFAVILAGMVLGAKKGALAILLYVLLGAAGLPVFAGFAGGFQCLAGPTGGFLISFPLMALISGLGAERGCGSKSAMRDPRTLLLTALGICVNYAAGTAVFCLLMDAAPGYALAVCVLPFIPGDLIKAALAILIGSRVRSLLPEGRVSR